jgi:phosphopantothenoylcysteine decarboxylase/phosphopantothenate--cysteine ligase
VRFLANRSSGKQGHALAAEAAARGADVVLVTASSLPAPAGVEVVPVETAAEMGAAVLARAADADVVLMAAAVADFRPKLAAGEKLDKAHGPPDLVLEPTADILAELGRRKPAGQVLVGFAAETSDLHARATDKLRRKNLDLVVANDVTAPGAGFGHDTNQAVLFDADGSFNETGLMAKRALAQAVLDVVVRKLDAHRPGRPVHGHDTGRSA